MVHNIATILGLALLLFGVFVFFTAVLGLFRFGDALSRMHAAAVGDALGIFCILAGLMLLHGWSLSGGQDGAGVFVSVADQPCGQPPPGGDGGYDSA